MVNSFIGLFKDTSLVLIIGLFDLLNMAPGNARCAVARLVQGRYLFAAVVYFIFCFAMSRYSIISNASCTPDTDAREGSLSRMAERAVLQSAAADEVMIQMMSVHKWYGQFHVLKDINLTVYKGERIVICGPSGSGKSTLIRCINRLEEHQKGKIIVDGIELTTTSRTSSRSAARSAWCSSISTSSRI